jgi:DNA-3-methyladenine glycosylase
MICGVNWKIGAKMKLIREFYTRPAVELAPLLLGKVLCRRTGDEIIRRAIIETEAYCGVGDTACHAHKGRTPRTETLYAKGGTSYVYLCYGIHNLFNVIAAEEGEPQGVLIRGVDGSTGPGRVTKLMRIDRSLNNADMCESDQLWLEDGPQREYTTAPRVGISYASHEDQAALWRFIAK